MPGGRTDQTFVVIHITVTDNGDIAGGLDITVVVIQRSGFKTHIATANLTIAVVERPGFQRHDTRFNPDRTPFTRVNQRGAIGIDRQHTCCGELAVGVINRATVNVDITHRGDVTRTGIHDSILVGIERDSAYRCHRTGGVIQSTICRQVDRTCRLNLGVAV